MSSSELKNSFSNTLRSGAGRRLGIFRTQHTAEKVEKSKSYALLLVELKKFTAGHFQQLASVVSQAK